MKIGFVEGLGVGSLITVVYGIPGFYVGTSNLPSSFFNWLVEMYLLTLFILSPFVANRLTKSSLGQTVSYALAGLIPLVIVALIFFAFAFLGAIASAPDA